MTLDVGTRSGFVAGIDQFRAAVVQLLGDVEFVFRIDYYRDVRNIGFNRGNCFVVRRAAVMTRYAVNPPLVGSCRSRDMFSDEVRTAAAGIVFIGGIGKVACRAEGQPGNIARCRRIPVTGVAGIFRLEGAAWSIVAMAVETAARRVAGFGNTGFVVVGPGVTDLAKSAVGGRVDETVDCVVIDNGVGRGVGPGTLHLGPNHVQVGGAVRIVALLAEHVLRAALGGEVGAHIPEGRYDRSRDIVTGSALGIGVGEGQTDVIAEYAGNMSRVGVMTTVAGRGAGKG